MAAAALGRCLLSGFRGNSRLAFSSCRRAASQSYRSLPVRCSVALTASRDYSSSRGGADCLFAKSHEWVRVEGNTATIGISEYAQDKLGEVVYVELPVVGTEVEKGDQVSVFESVKAVAEVYTSLSGEVTEVNEELENSPNLINEDSFGKGWLAKLKVSNAEEVADLMTHEQYEQYIAQGDV
jgi:glycine cleavage system H protein